MQKFTHILLILLISNNIAVFLYGASRLVRSNLAVAGYSKECAKRSILILARHSFADSIKEDVAEEKIVYNNREYIFSAGRLLNEDVFINIRDKKDRPKKYLIKHHK